jgi:hypothetical protein
MRSNLQKYKLEIKQQKLVEMEYKIYANGLVYWYIYIYSIETSDIWIHQTLVEVECKIYACQT